jgi:hypothetical protein
MARTRAVLGALALSTIVLAGCTTQTVYVDEQGNRLAVDAQGKPVVPWRQPTAEAVAARPVPTSTPSTFEVAARAFRDAGWQSHDGGKTWVRRGEAPALRGPRLAPPVGAAPAEPSLPPPPTTADLPVTPNAPTQAAPATGTSPDCPAPGAPRPQDPYGLGAPPGGSGSTPVLPPPPPKAQDLPPSSGDLGTPPTAR